MSMTARFELFVEDTAKTIDFYTKILGFHKIKSNLERDHHELKRDNIQINVGSIYKLREGHYFRPQIEDDRKGLGVEIVLEVDDIYSLYKQVQESGYKFYEELTDRPWGLTDFRLVDPDGYYLRLTSRK